jgi:hypothetical protein
VSRGCLRLTSLGIQILHFLIAAELRTLIGTAAEGTKRIIIHYEQESKLSPSSIRFKTKSSHGISIHIEGYKFCREIENTRTHPPTANKNNNTLNKTKRIPQPIYEWIKKIKKPN